MRIIKRNGAETDFDTSKIQTAIGKAAKGKNEINEETILNIARLIEQYANEVGRALSVEEIQDKVEDSLIHEDAPETAKAYIRYRYQKNLARESNTTDDQILSIVEYTNEEVKQENSNKDPQVVSVQRDYIAGEVSKDITRRLLLPPEVVKAHDEGLIHFHDADYFLCHEHNCDLINLEDMLQNGTVISGTKIDKPHSFATACNIATQIIAQVASGQYGGQSITLSHLAPFVDISRKKIRSQVFHELSMILAQEPSAEQIEKVVEARVKEEIERGIQTIQYQVVTLMTTNGQAPFITVFMYLDEVPEGQTRDDLALVIEAMLNQRIQGVKNEAGAYVTPAFPKLIYVLDEDNIREGTPYYYLTELAAQCTAKRMVPDYISAKKMKELKVDSNGEGNVYPCMGCRSFLTTYVDPLTGKGKYYGRFNQGVVTINLVDVACSVKEGTIAPLDLDHFWHEFDERLELCHRALRCRHERLKGTVSDVSPIHWQHGALARLQPGEKIDKLLYNGYSTISLGYAGLWECVYELIGKKLTEPEGEALGLQIMEYMNMKFREWKQAENIDYSLYGTPLESTTYKFAKALQKRWGKIPGVTDRNYITNSYHVHVTEPIDAFDKLRLESKFQALSPGGAISYVEVPDMQSNIAAVISVMQYIYDTILYAELNTKSDYCQVCGFDGEITIEEDKGKLVWECPNCGNRDQSKLNVARRTCGYIGTQFWNQGRTQEIKERVLHL